MRRFPAMLGAVVVGLALLRAGPQAPGRDSRGCARADPDREGERTCTIEGVVRRQGRPAAAFVTARLRIENEAHYCSARYHAGGIQRELRIPAPDRPPLARARSAEDGRFELRGLAPGRYDVLALDRDGWRGGVHVPLHAAGERRQADPVLRPATERLAGILRYADGRPFQGRVLINQGAPIYAHGYLAQPLHEAYGTTDAEGRFEVAGLAPGRAHVVALLPGRLFAVSPPTAVPRGAPFEFVVDGGPRREVGRVVDRETGRGIGAARLTWVAWDGDGSSCGIAVTEADGTFDVGLPLEVSRVWGLYVEARGHGGLRLDFAPPSRLASMALRRAARLEGRVTAAGDRRPVAGVRVYARYVDWGNPAWRPKVEPVLTDAEGRYAVPDLPWGEVRLQARGQGWVTRGTIGRDRARGIFDPLRWPLVPGEATVADLVVERGLEARGRVLDPRGRPVAGASVWCEEESGDVHFRCSGHYPPPCAATDADGVYRVPGLLPGEAYEFRAAAPGYARTRSQVWKAPRRAAEEAEPAVADAPEIRFAVPCWVDVRVLDAETRQPVPDARLDVSIEDRARERDWLTGHDGRARVGPLPPRSGRVSVRAPYHLYEMPRPFGVPTPEGTPFTIEVRRARTIEGRVVFPDGTPAANAQVHVANKTGFLVGHYRGVKRCGSDGRFVAEAVDVIAYELRAEIRLGRQVYEARRDVTGGDRDVVLELAVVSETQEEAPGTEVVKPAFRVRVRDPGGRLVPRFAVRAAWAPAPGLPEEGVAALDLPPKPAGWLEVCRARADDDYPLPCGPLRVKQIDGEPGEIDLRLPPERRVSGAVRDERGEPVRAVRVFAVPVRTITDPPATEDLSHDDALTDADGVFSLGRLGNEDYELQLHPPAHLLLPRAAVRCRAGRTGVEIRLRRAVSAVVRLHDPRRLPVRGLRVEATRRGWDYNWRHGWSRVDVPHAQGVTEASGTVVLSGLDGDLTYTLRVTRDDPMRFVGEHEIEGWSPKDTQLTVPVRGELRGRVVDGQGHPVPGARVYYLEAAGGRWASRTADAEGAFHLEYVPEGKRTLAATPAHQWAPDDAAQTVEAQIGDTELRLVVEPGATLTVRIEGVPAGIEHLSALLAPQAESERRALRTATVSDGVATFEGLRPGARYRLWVRVDSPGDGLVLDRADLVPGPEEVRLRLRPGLTLRGRLLGPDPLEDTWIHAWDGYRHANGEVQGREYVVRGLSPGCWKLKAEARSGEVPYEGRAEAEAGRVADIRLEVEE